jgi:hypothetical protein
MPSRVTRTHARAREVKEASPPERCWASGLKTPISRVHGRPVEKVETKTEAVQDMSLDELRALRTRAAGLPAPLPSG